MVTKTISLFQFNELNDKAKDKVRQWYLDDPIRCDVLSDDFKWSFIEYFFPNSNLDVQWSLGYCQGDGVNICGELRLEDIMNYIRKWNPNEHRNRRYDPTNRLTPKEMRTLDFYIDQAMTTVTLPRNNRYAYCIARDMDLAEDMIWYLQDWNIRDINKDLIEKFEKICVSIIEDLCGEMASFGYEFLYEVDDDEIEESCEVNGWYFTSAGKFEPYDGDDAT